MKALETSKKITWVFIVVYILALVSVAILQVVGHNIQFILDYLQQIMIVIVFSYFAKSGVENFEKIRLNPQFNRKEENEVD